MSTDHENIRLWRDGGGTARATITHAIVQHSPDGFEWGYAGSGPADLALNILFDVSGDRELAERLHQDFKAQVIAKLPREGATLSRSWIRAWIHVRSKGGEKR